MIKYSPMKTTIFIIIAFALTFTGNSVLKAQSSQNLAICASNMGEDATYLKDFQVDLGEAVAGGQRPVAKFSMILNKNTQYKFLICNNPGSQGRAVMTLYDSNTQLASSYIEASKKEFPGFEFNCTKTGVYHVFISFLDGKQGSAVGILAFTKKL
jgi:hypothetical protein